MRLWHYTCDHGAPGIRRDGHVKPAHQVLLGAELAWFTDLHPPIRTALGLTSHILDCDRLAHGFPVLYNERIEWWPRWARRHARGTREALEAATGAMPAHWWVSTAPVRVDVLAPTGAR